MPGCPNGADPTPAAAGLQKLIDLTSFSASLATLFHAHQPTSIAGFTASLIDVNALCALNPDPPRELTALDFVAGLAYSPGELPGITNPLTSWIYEWLRYQAFLNFCVCRAIVPDPSLNCLHAVNLTIGTGLNHITALPSVTIEAAVYDSWLVFPNGDMRFAFNSGKVTTTGDPLSTNWTVQIQGSDGVWRSVWNGSSFPEGSHADNLFTIQNGLVAVPRTANLRILSSLGTANVLASLDLCFTPLSAAPRPLPPDPDVPNLPVVPAPVCSTDDLCAIVQELSRQLTRVSAQVADIQAAQTTTDQYVELASRSLSGEGEAPVVLGTRAVSVELTVLGPSVFTSALGRPRGLMRAGSLRWGTGSGYTPRVFIDGDRWVVNRPQGALSISWQLLEGTSGTVHFLG